MEIQKTRNGRQLKDNWLTKDLKQNYNLYLMIALPFLLVVIFCYLPLYGIIIAFKDYELTAGYMESPWVGIKHFESFFQDPYCFRLIRNTILLGVYNLAWTFWPPIVLAILLNEVRGTWFKKIVQSISYMPHFVATVVVVGMLMELFGTGGVVNSVIVFFGGEEINFFNESQYFRSLYIGSGIWQGVGFSSIVYLAALTGVDQEMYEAAYIDGANRFQRIWYISLPSILPVVTILLILNTSSVINVGFEKAYLMQNPAIYETSDVIATYLYRRGIVDRDFSYSTAVGLLNSVVSFIILFITNAAVKLLDGDSLF